VKNAAREPASCLLYVSSNFRVHARIPSAVCGSAVSSCSCFLCRQLGRSGPTDRANEVVSDCVATQIVERFLIKFSVFFLSVQTRDELRDKRVNATVADSRNRKAAPGEESELHSSSLGLGWLRVAYGRLRRDKAPGYDGQTVRDYGNDMDRRLTYLLTRVKGGSYYAPPAEQR
jgi:hypothetical protein